MFDTLAPASYPAALRRAEPLARRPRKYDVQHLEDNFSARFWPLVSGILYQDVFPSEFVASYPQWHRRAAAAPRHAGAPSHPTAARPCCQDLSTNAFGDTDSERPSLVTLCKFMHRIRHMTSWLHIPSWYRATERWPSPCPNARPATALDDMTTYHYRASHDVYKRTSWLPDSLTTASCLQWEMIYMIHILYMRIYLWRLVYDIWYIEYMMYDMYERYARYHMCEIYIWRIYNIYDMYQNCYVWYMVYDVYDMVMVMVMVMVLMVMVMVMVMMMVMVINDSW